MKLLGWFLLLLVIAYYVVLQINPYRQNRTLPDSILISNQNHLETEIARREKEGALPFKGLDDVKEMKKEKRTYALELARRKYRLDHRIPWLAFLGVGIIAFFKIRRRMRTDPEGKKKREKKKVRQIPEAPPREEYVDEYDYPRRIEGGFETREEALEWLDTDPLKNCDYCGAEMRSTTNSQGNALELVTFYKRVPEGAKDLRVTLGSRWFVRAANELQCVSCDRLVRR